MKEARGKAFSDMYKKLGSKEGEKDIYRLAKIRDKKRKNLLQIRCIKDGNQKLLVRDEEVKERWVSYFNKLYNGEGDRSDVDLVDVSDELNRRFVCKIRVQEVKDALKKMKTTKPLGLDGVPIEVW
ncbi:DYW_deaminase domain-containing protein [Psidium guajava]|nr:DYW_deaminase domain-containing protein [Psidium guajava]